MRWTCLALSLLSACSGGVAGSGDEDGTGAALTAVAPSATLEQLAVTYADPANYAQVQTDANAILEGYGLDPSTAPGCAIFYSTALGDLAGIEVPKVTHDGIDVRINTTELSWYLTTQLGWQRLTSHTQLEPGDAVFTRPATATSTHPAHVYLFNGWIDDQYAFVIDNQAVDYCDPTNAEFVGWCDADGGGSNWCCRGEGLFQWKRSVTVDMQHADSTTSAPDTDQRMGYALRAPR